MDIIVLLQQAVLNHASDIFVVAGLPVSYRTNGRICREKEEKLMPPQTKECVEELYKLAGGRDIRVLLLLFRDFRDSVSVRTNRGGRSQPLSV